MAFTPAIITATVFDQDNNPQDGARVSLELSDFDITNNGAQFITPTRREFVTGSNGEVTFNIFPNDQGTKDTFYLLNIYGAGTTSGGKKLIDNFKIKIPSGESDLSGLISGIINARPVAAFTMTPSSGTAPLMVALNGAGSYDPDGTIAAYTYRVDGLSIGTTQSLNYTFTNPGTYSVSLDVEDDVGAIRTTSQNITVGSLTVVNPDSAFTVNPTSGTRPLIVGVASQAVAGTYPITTTEYNYGTGYATGTSYQFNTAGTFTITQRVTDSQGNTDTSTQNVTVSASPTLDAEALVVAVESAAPLAVLTITPNTGSNPLSATVNGSGTTIQGYAAALAAVNALPTGFEKTTLLARLNSALSSLTYTINLT
ncbi:MAG: PKD domain-containing protein [Pseudomonadota bacterium]